MSVIAFNAVLKIEDSDLPPICRVVCCPTESDDVFIVTLPPLVSESHAKDAEDATKKEEKDKVRAKPFYPKMQKIARATLDALEFENKLRSIKLEPEHKHQLKEEELSNKERAIREKRNAIMTPFMDHERLSAALLSSRGLGALVRPAMAAHDCPRSLVYRLFGYLCIYGFEAGSLNPRYDRRGGPGSRRPCDELRRNCEELRKKAGRKSAKELLGIPEENPQQGSTKDWVIKVVAADSVIPKPKPAFKMRYDLIIKSGFVTKYVHTQDGLKPVMPRKGTYPNQRQVRYIFDTQIGEIERVLEKTTVGHFARNFRGLHGFAWEGVAGPGHRYAMDSTLGDVFLRSSINRAWIIGRPIVYLVVCTWSTAIVGFYVCLSGPSWSTAKVALFSTFANPGLLGSLWGYMPVLALTPTPAIPYSFLFDRGEYLSAGATATSEEIGFNKSFNPPYRPDLKGLVEVQNRIAKDTQYLFVPGAIDARRKEFELRTDPSKSAFVTRQYVQYLYSIFTQYNLFADRRHRMTTDMLAAGVYPSPAGLWKFGHDIGIGYRKEVPESRLITNLLPDQEAVVNRKGIYLGQLLYESELVKAEQWTAMARNYGARWLPVHYFPGATKQIWWSDPTGRGVEMFNLSANARAPGDITHDEWLDAWMYEKTKLADREHERLRASLEMMAQNEALRKDAIEATAKADAAYSGPKPTATEARALEREFGDAPIESNQPEAAPDQSDKSSEYEDAMRAIYREAAEAEVARG